MTNSTDVSGVEMTRFGQRVDLIKERHGRVKDEAKIESRGTNWDDIIAERYVCKIREFETLLFCANKKKFSFRWIGRWLDS